MKNILIRAVIAAAVMLSASNQIRAQENKWDFGLDYATEVQTNFGRKANWVNLLSLNAEFTPWYGGEFYIQTISTYKTRKKRIANDLQTFSNIEEENMALNIFLLGYAHHFNSVSLFAGVRNVNEDYFTSGYTSLFTNSSCGIYPTLSENFPLANYPVSTLSLHAEFYLSESWTIKNSLYNGIAGKLYGSEPSIFNIRPKHDGIFSITALSYASATAEYTVGSAFHSGHKESGIRQQKNYTLWGSVEQSLYKRGAKEIGLLLQGSFAPDDRNECKNYFGGGVLLKGFVSSVRPDSFGIFANRAAFQEVTETAIEATWQYEILRNFTIQPAFHLIIRKDKTDTIGILRLCYCL